jgi:16S rRNA (adenine1518-N6/adenine1519-N6)-dimethyltransferase
MDLWQAATSRVSNFPIWESAGLALPFLYIGGALSQIAILRKHGIRLRKSLGQHILVDDNIAEKIVESMGIDKDEAVFEIGPGLGALTRRLASAAGRVIAVEIDRRMAEVLKSLTVGVGNIEILNANILKVDIASLVSQSRFETWKIVGNLPYYITSSILMWLIEARAHFSSAVVTVQEEYARRLVAGPGSKDYSSLSICVQYRFKPEVLFTIKPTSFLPRPDVRSAVVRLGVLERPSLDVRDEGLFFQTIRAAFGQRRKTLKRSLRQIPGVTPDNMGELGRMSGVGLDDRPENVSIEEFARLSNAIKGLVG